MKQGMLLLSVMLTLSLMAQKKPSILVMVSDDHGYVDTGFQGGKDVPTPHLDALAKSGVRCTSGYISHPFCSPSRAGLLTGRQQQRFGHECNPVYDPLDEKEGLPMTERLLPQFMKDGGYVTGWVGKWHLGSAAQFVPWKRGFDECFGFIGGGHAYKDWTPTGRQYMLALTRNGEPVPGVENEHLTGVLGREGAAFITRNKENPWFLYLAFNAPHTPHQPTLEREKQFESVKDVNRRRYLAQVSLLDDAIGKVMEALAASGQKDNTLVFFFSDNGGAVHNAASNGVLRAGKGTVYEGGIRVPFLVSWPAKLPAGTSYDQPVSSLDVFATSLGCAGVPVPTDKPYDSVNLIPFLIGGNKESPHQSIFWRLQGKKGGMALREGKWKLVKPTEGDVELYDVVADIGETKDIAKANPEMVARLSKILEEKNSQMIDPVFLGSSVKNEDWGPGGINQKNNPKPKAKAKANRPVRE